MRQTLPKSNILRGYKRFNRVLSEGSSIFGKHMTCYVYFVSQPKDDGSNIAIGFSVPKKKVPLAVHRNTVKRYIREAVRKHIHGLDETLKEKKKSIEIVLMLKNRYSGKKDQQTAADFENDWIAFQKEIEAMI